MSLCIQTDWEIEIQRQVKCHCRENNCIWQERGTYRQPMEYQENPKGVTTLQNQRFAIAREFNNNNIGGNLIVTL